MHITQSSLYTVTEPARGRGFSTPSRFRKSYCKDDSVENFLVIVSIGTSYVTEGLLFVSPDLLVVH
jgi:hypothetical protein